MTPPGSLKNIGCLWTFSSDVSSEKNTIGEWEASPHGKTGANDNQVQSDAIAVFVTGGNPCTCDCFKRRDS